jgi:hypothetical protein
MKNIVIIGVGGFGREIKILVDNINAVNPTYKTVGFYDDAENLNTSYNGIPYLGTIADLNAITEETAVVIALGDPRTKLKIKERLSNSKLDYYM